MDLRVQICRATSCTSWHQGFHPPYHQIHKASARMSTRTPPAVAPQPAGCMGPPSGSPAQQPQPAKHVSPNTPHTTATTSMKPSLGDTLRHVIGRTWYDFLFRQPGGVSRTERSATTASRAGKLAMAGEMRAAREAPPHRSQLAGNNHSDTSPRAHHPPKTPQQKSLELWHAVWRGYLKGSPPEAWRSAREVEMARQSPPPPATDWTSTTSSMSVASEHRRSLRLPCHKVRAARGPNRSTWLRRDGLDDDEDGRHPRHKEHEGRAPFSSASTPVLERAGDGRCCRHVRFLVLTCQCWRA